MTLSSPEAAAQTRIFVKAAGGNATWDRLAEHLEHSAHAREVFVINRSFEAPIAHVFDMWTTPEHLSQWLPPTGFRMAFHRVDLRTGGSAFFEMTNGEMTMHGVFEYRLVKRPDRVEYVQWFTNAAEELARHPGAPTWPDKMLTTVILAAEGDAQTRVTVRSEVFGPASPEEVAAFVAERGGMTKGWTGSFDALEAMLASSPV